MVPRFFDTERECDDSGCVPFGRKQFIFGLKSFSPERERLRDAVIAEGWKRLDVCPGFSGLRTALKNLQAHESYERKAKP